MQVTAQPADQTQSSGIPGATCASQAQLQDTCEGPATGLRAEVARTTPTAADTGDAPALDAPDPPDVQEPVLAGRA